MRVPIDAKSVLPVADLLGTNMDRPFVEKHIFSARHRVNISDLKFIKLVTQL